MDAKMPRTIWLKGAKDNSLHVMASGSGKLGCVFIHGFADGAFVWTPIAPALDALCASYCVDLRGHGRSEWTGSYEVDDYLSDLNLLISHIDHESYILVGHSLGGGLAWRIARSNPDIARGLVLIDYSPEPDVDAVDGVRDTFYLNSKRAFRTEKEFSDVLLRQRPLLSGEMAAMIAAHALSKSADGLLRLRADPGIRRAALTASGVPSPDWSELAKVTCPTLVVRGQGSALLSRATSERLVATLARARSTVVPRAGHAVMTDNPTYLASALRDFVASCAP